ncbi:MAG: 4-hydroxyphenylpyruvate dioxygenase, partial [Gemmatimonadaceae bacterium]
LETGNRQATGYVLEQGRARFLLTTPLTANSAAAEHIRQHGDGVHDIAFEVDDADAAFAAAVARGAKPAVEPHDWEDAVGVVRHAAIHTYGETLHSFISRNGYSGPFLPGYRKTEIRAQDKGILRIDHVVGNVGLGEMNQWADWYSKVLGFKRFLSFDDKDISTEYSALMSVVMADDSESIKFPINEPAPGRKKSQIDEYLEWYGGPGVQHIALQTRDIVATVRALQGDGVEFLRVPDTYYELLPERMGKINESLPELKQLGVLVDRDQDGYLLQIFSKPVEDRPTLFFEIIDRHGCRGFGKGNFRALFEAIEREQAVRGNL